MSKLSHAKHARHAAPNQREGAAAHTALGYEQDAVSHAAPTHGRGAASHVAPTHGRGTTSHVAPTHGLGATSYAASTHGRGTTSHAASADKRGMPVAAKVLVGVGIALVVLVAAAAICLFSYFSRLDSALDAHNNVAADQALASTSSQDNGKTINEATEPFYVLLMGSDSREGNATSKLESEQGENQRSDVIMLARVDVPNRQITLVSVPRDTPYRDANGTLVKINELFNAAGPAAMISAVSELTGVPISHYVTVSFSQLQEMVDLLGGVTVEVPTTLEYKDALTGEKVRVEAGTQVLTGQQAQIFARARHEFSDYQDMSRQGNVRALLAAMLDRIFELPLTELPGTVVDLASCVETDMRSADIVPLAWAYATSPRESGTGDGAGAGEQSHGFTLYSCTGPYEGDINEESGWWLCYENPEAWARLMEVVDSGGNPEQVDVSSSAS